MKHKHITIYLPDGTKEHFTTSKDVVDTEIELVDKIECEGTAIVHIAFKDGDRVEGYSYVNMPYVLNMF